MLRIGKAISPISQEQNSADLTIPGGAAWQRMPLLPWLFTGKCPMKPMPLSVLKACLLIASISAVILVSGCGSDGSTDQIGVVPDDAQQNSGQLEDFSGTYTAQFFSLAGGSAPGMYTISQDGPNLSLQVSCMSNDERIDCASMNQASGTVSAAGDDVRFPFSLSNETVVITGQFIRQSQGILLEAEVSGTTDANSGQLRGAQPLQTSSGS
jgi:hypothetical protein